MEWGGLLIQALMLGGFLLWEGFVKQKGKNLAIKDDARDISYEQEKGRSIAIKEDLKKITEQMETIKNEISFENQRRHIYIEQRTNRFIEILHLAEELRLYGNLLSFYLYDNHSTEKISLLIDNSNKTLLKLIHECRLLTVSIDDKAITDSTNKLVESTQQYVAFICYIASNGMNYLKNWKNNFDLAHQKDGNASCAKLAIECMKSLANTRQEFEDGIKSKESDLYDNTINYLSLLKKLFDKEFYLKFDFSDSKAINPES